ncbi:hypothetical protein NL676_035524 [Syzygium grande]|nr:hypothetical protein NL676_035524 [Syzygium grande]
MGGEKSGDPKRRNGGESRIRIGIGPTRSSEKMLQRVRIRPETSPRRPSEPGNYVGCGPGHLSNGDEISFP